MVSHIINSALGGVVANKATQGIDEVTGGKPFLAEHGECVHDDIHAIRDYLKEIAKAHKNFKEDKFEVLNIPVAPSYIPLSPHGYRHTSLLVPDNTTVYTISVHGVTAIDFTPTVAGWVQLDLPEGSTIAVKTGGTSVSVLLRCSDNRLGNVF